MTKKSAMKATLPANYDLNVWVNAGNSSRQQPFPADSWWELMNEFCHGHIRKVFAKKVLEEGKDCSESILYQIIHGYLDENEPFQMLEILVQIWPHLTKGSKQSLGTHIRGTIATQLANKIFREMVENKEQSND